MTNRNRLHVQRACRLSYLAFVLVVATGVSPACGRVVWTRSWKEARILANDYGRPIFALGVSASCGPCQALKQMLKSGEELGDVLDRYVVLEMDAGGRDFTQFLSATAASFSGAVPAWYVLQPDLSIQYAEIGLVTAETLRPLLGQVAEESVVPITLADRRRFRIAIDEAQRLSDEGRLATALRRLEPITLRTGSSPLQDDARELQASLLRTLEQRLESFRVDLRSGHEPHAAALHCAELFVLLAKHPDLRRLAREIMDEAEAKPQTRKVMAQAKLLVRGRIAEGTRRHELARATYREAVELDPESPLASFANDRLGGIQALVQTGTGG